VKNKLVIIACSNPSTVRLTMTYVCPRPEFLADTQLFKIFAPQDRQTFKDKHLYTICIQNSDFLAKYQLFLSHFIETRIFSTVFRKILKHKL